jgi:hypothetical protein
MPATDELFLRPKLRDGVTVDETAQTLCVTYRDQSCDLEIDGVDRQDVLAFLQDLQRGAQNAASLKSGHTRLGNAIDGLLEEFDRLGLLTEAEFEQAPGTLSGSDFNVELRALAQRVMASRCGSEFHARMQSGSISRNALIGFALEYYYIVRGAPGFMAPALAAADSWKNQRTLQRFFASELNHDRMLAESLHSVGISTDALDYLQPLPATFALAAALGVFARQHPLSFKSILFLFEQPSREFHEAFQQSCIDLGLPKAFHEPIVRHANINEDLDHGDITRALLEDVTAVSQEEQTVVRKNLVTTIESMSRQDREILDYYESDAACIPRVYH